MKLVILGRDGVINEVGDDVIRSPEAWQPIPGSLEAIARLNQAGYRVLVTTNQPGLARGLLDIETLIRIHERMRSLAGEVGATIDAVFFCPHRPADRCECHKPRPGLLLDAATRLRTGLREIPVVGDEAADLEAARASGARPILVRTGRGSDTANRYLGAATVPNYPDLAGFVDDFLNGGLTPL